MLSTLVYESRRPDDAAAPRMPGGEVRAGAGRDGRDLGRPRRVEREHHLDQLREPDLGFAWAAWRWAEGDELDDILRVADLAGR